MRKLFVGLVVSEWVCLAALTVMYVMGPRTLNTRIGLGLVAFCTFTVSYILLNNLIKGHFKRKL